MRSADRLTVLCAVLLLILFTLFPIPSVLLSLLATDGAAPTAASRTSSHHGAPALSANYASAFLGASVVSVEPSSCHGGSALISDSPDKYVLCPCAAPRKQFVVQLIRDVEVRTVVVRNAEHFSSGVRNFTLLGSRRYPTSTWELLGTFEAEPRRGRQSFAVAPHSPARYVKLQWATSHGTEPWCTITSFQVYGIDVLETLTRLGDDDEEGEATDVALLNGEAAVVASPPGTVQQTDTHAVPGTAAASTHTQPVLSGPEAASIPSLVDLEELATVGGESAITLDTEKLFAPSQTAVTEAVAATADALFSLFPASCSGVFSAAELNASAQCHTGDFFALWQQCQVAVCDAASTPTAGGTARPTAATGKKSPPAFHGTAGSLLAQLLRQQRAQAQELATMLEHEKQLAQELNRTRGLLSGFYARYRESLKESQEHRDRLRKVEVELQLLQQRLLVRERGTDTSSAAAKNSTTLAVAALLLSTVALVVAFVSVTSSSQRFVGSPTKWGRQFSLNGGSGGR